MTPERLEEIEIQYNDGLEWPFIHSEDHRDTVLALVAKINEQHDQILKLIGGLEKYKLEAENGRDAIYVLASLEDERRRSLEAEAYPYSTHHPYNLPRVPTALASHECSLRPQFYLSARVSWLPAQLLRLHLRTPCRGSHPMNDNLTAVATCSHCNVPPTVALLPSCIFACKECSKLSFSPDARTLRPATEGDLVGLPPTLFAVAVATLRYGHGSYEYWQAMKRAVDEGSLELRPEATPPSYYLELT